jgi:hypothetical protein
VNILKLVRSDLSARASLLGSSLLLDKMIRSLTSRRRSTTHSQKFADRFREADSSLLDLITRWESSYASDFPVFHAWVKLQRARLPIKEIGIEGQKQLEHVELQVFDFLRRKEDLIRDSRVAQTELESILTIFTPSLEEAFANISDDVSDTAPDHRLQEAIGTNDELFSVARQKYNYLLKKLIPQMSSLINECNVVNQGIAGYSESHPNISDDRWKKCLRSLADISNSLEENTKRILSSSTYNNLMVLLASQESTRPRPKRPRAPDKDEDKEYDDWF